MQVLGGARYHFTMVCGTAHAFSWGRPCQCPATPNSSCTSSPLALVCSTDPIWRTGMPSSIDVTSLPIPLSQTTTESRNCSSTSFIHPSFCWLSSGPGCLETYRSA